MSPPSTAVAVVDEKPGVPANATTQLSYSGTPRYRGESRPDEYVRDLADPVKRMEIFDEMRGSDESVATALHAREQMIGSSNWMLSCEDDKPKSKEILEFCEDNIYPVLGDLLRHLAGAIQYGFGACETVFEWSDRPFTRNIVRGKIRRPTRQSGRRIYLRKLAHIRQRTIHSFLVPISGDLEALRQYVYTGFTFAKTDIPADKVLLWTYNRRGDDYWGYPPTRNCYRAWKFKQQLEKLNLLGVDRFGVGTPIAEEGEGWTEPDRRRLHEFLAAWRSGQNTFLAHPFGGKISIATAQGQAIMNVLEWVKFYGVAIAKTYLTQLSELGTTDTGSRAVGESFSDQLEGVVQSDCEDVASIINEDLIPRLVDWNFGPQESYPVFAPSARLQIDAATAGMINTLKQSGAVAWDARDEAWLRDALGMHDIDIKERQAEIDEKKKQAEEAAKLLPAGQPQRALPPGTRESPDPAKAQLRALSAGRPDPATADAPLRTIEFTEWEARVLRPEIVGRDLDLEQVRLTAEVQSVLRDIDLELRNKAEDLALQGPAMIAANIRTLAVSGALKRQLRNAMQKAADRIRAYGSNAVFSEVARQETGDTIGPARSPRGALGRFALAVREAVLSTDPTPEELQRNLAIAAEVDRAVEDEVDRRESSVRNSLLTAIQMAGGLSIATFAGAVRQAIQQALESLSPARTNDNVGGVINVAFGVGRADATSEIVASVGGGTGGGGTGDGPRVVGHISGPVAKVYSAVMDGGTCEECAKWDGGQFPIDYPEDVTGVQAPNPRCHGSYKRCRCVWILITDREMQSTIPAAKGPLDYPAARLTRRVTTHSRN